MPKKRARRKPLLDSPDREVAEALHTIVGGAVELGLRLEELKAKEENRQIDAERLREIREYKKQIDELIRKLYK